MSPVSRVSHETVSCHNLNILNIIIKYNFNNLNYLIICKFLRQYHKMSMSLFETFLYLSPPHSKPQSTEQIFLSFDYATHFSLFLSSFQLKPGQSAAFLLIVSLFKIIIPRLQVLKLTNICLITCCGILVWKLSLRLLREQIENRKRAKYYS